MGKVHRTSRNSRRGIGWIAALASGLIVVAGAAAALAANSTSSQSSASPAANVAEAKRIIKQAKSPAAARFVSPGVPIDISKVDKPIWLLMHNDVIPFDRNGRDGFIAAAKAAGVPYKIFVGRDMVSEYQRGIRQAIQEGAGAVVIWSIHPDSIRQALVEAQKAGVKIISGLNSTMPGGVIDKGTNGYVSFDYTRTGKLLAAYAVAANGAKTNALFYNTPEFKTINYVRDGFLAEMHRLCPTCKAASRDVTYAQATTLIPADVSSRIKRDTSINWIMAGFDGLAEFVVQGVKAAGAVDRVKVGSQNGSPDPTLKWIQQGNVQAVSVGEPNQWVGWALFDQGVRVYLGKPSKDEHVPLKVLDASNLKGSDLKSEDKLYKMPPPSSPAYYKNGYARTWGLKK